MELRMAKKLKMMKIEMPYTKHLDNPEDGCGIRFKTFV
jgi:hypothetical protein